MRLTRGEGDADNETTGPAGLLVVVVADVGVFIFIEVAGDWFAVFPQAETAGGSEAGKFFGAGDSSAANCLAIAPRESGGVCLAEDEDMAVDVSGLVLGEGEAERPACFLLGVMKSRSAKDDFSAPAAAAGSEICGGVTFSGGESTVRPLKLLEIETLLLALVLLGAAGLGKSTSDSFD